MEISLDGKTKTVTASGNYPKTQSNSLKNRGHPTDMMCVYNCRKKVKNANNNRLGSICGYDGHIRDRDKE